MSRFWASQQSGRSRFSPMRQTGAGWGRLFGAALTAALVAAPGAARADGCDFSDIWNAVDNTVTSIASGACAAACAEGAGCAAAGVLAGGLGVYAAAQGQGAADNFCNQLNTTITDLNNLESWLNGAGIDSGVVSALAGAADPISAAQCACDMEQGVGQLTSSLGACLVDLFCALPLSNCPCTPSPPQLVDCSQIMNENSNPAPAQVTSVTNGTLVVAAFQTCSPTYCFCPSPMVLGENPISTNGSCGWPCQNSWWCDCGWTYSCQCPQGTTPAASSGPLSQVCICNDTHLVAVPPTPTPYNPGGQICPIPLTGLPCPQGQVNFKGNCVPACASNQVRAPDGHCCDPTQVSSCGTCCPPGWQPNPTDGTCSTPIIQ